MSLVKFAFERFANERRHSQKKLCLLVRMVRNVDLTTEVCWFNRWDKRSFGVLKEAAFHLTPELLATSIPDLICSDLWKFEEEIGCMTLEAFQRISMRTDSFIPLEAINQHISLICEGVGKSPI